MREATVDHPELLEVLSTSENFFSPVACEDMNKVTVPLMSRMLPSALAMLRGLKKALIFSPMSEKMAYATISLVQPKSMTMVSLDCKQLLDTYVPFI